MIREATLEDAEAIAKIYNHYVKNTPITFEEEEVSTETMARRINSIQQSGFSWLVAMESEGVVGYAYSSRCWGTKLYSELFSFLRRKEIHAVIGGITLPNPASVAIHEKFGMEKVAHFKEVGYKFDEWLDVGYWQLHLVD